jgi:hypothetical protein
MIWMVIALTEHFMQPRASLIDLDDHAATEITQRVQAEEETERARIAEEGETERARIEARRDGTIASAIATGVVALLAVMGVGLWAWGRGRGAPPVPPPQIIIAALPLLQEDSSRRVEEVDGEWFVVDDARRTLYPLLTGPTARWSARTTTGDER